MDRKTVIVNLIYTMAYGIECFREALLMVESLRTVGRFSGEIHVYTDSNEDIKDATVIRSCDLLAMRSLLIARYFIGKSADYRRYERVMWLDSDVMAVRPIYELFDLPGLWIATDGIVKSIRDIPAFSLPERPCVVGETGYNTGTMVGDALGWNSFCQTVWSQIVHSQAWGITCADQPVVNHLMRTGNLHMNALPPGTVYFFVPDSPIGDNTMLIHARATMTALEQMRFVQWRNHDAMGSMAG